jgi:hypothetical protein
MLFPFFPLSYHLPSLPPFHLSNFLHTDSFDLPLTSYLYTLVILPHLLSLSLFPLYQLSFPLTLLPRYNSINTKLHNRMRSTKKQHNTPHHHTTITSIYIDTSLLHPNLCLYPYITTTKTEMQRQNSRVCWMHEPWL